MLFIYLIFNTILILISYHFFKRKFNPVSVYSIIWALMLIGFEIKLFYYNDLNFITWLVIISFQLSYTIGCFVGATINNSNKNTSFGLKINDKNHDDTSKKLKQIIILLSLVSAFSIIPNLINLYKQYGSNILASSALIYHDRLTGNRSFELIPYLGSLSHVAVILSGVFFIRYGYKFFLIIPFILLILNILPTGGRMDLLYGILYLLIPILLHKKRLKKTFRFKHKLIVSIIGGVFLFILATISNVRTINKTHPSYMSPLMSKLFNKNPVFASIYTYTTAPIGVLNKFISGSSRYLFKTPIGAVVYV